MKSIPEEELKLKRNKHHFKNLNNKFITQFVSLMKEKVLLEQRL